MTHESGRLLREHNRRPAIPQQCSPRRIGMSAVKTTSPGNTQAVHHIGRLSFYKGNEFIALGRRYSGTLQHTWLMLYCLVPVPRGNLRSRLCESALF
ncbi:hypothetical protein BH012_09965 [Salmonella enterica]|nr:hypothetical protein [Salmonella enterica]EAX6601647.1 hypothetical protein [Salmonella enterica]